MKELSHAYVPNPELRNQYEAFFERTSFISERGDVIRSGHEATVYKRGDLDFVVKEPIGELGRTAISGYTLAMKHLDSEVMARTFFVESLPIKVDFKRRVIQMALIQERVKPLEGEFIRLVKEKKVDALIDLLKRKVFLDKEVLRRGVFIQDPELKNCGIRGNGEVVLFDPGRAVADPSCDEFHLTRVFNRGWTHYSIYMRLQDWGGRELVHVLEYPNQLVELYASETGLNFDPKINASTHLLLGFLSEQDLAVFTGRTYADLAQEELDKWFPIKVTPHPDAKNWGSGHLDEWTTLEDGTWARKIDGNQDNT